MTTRTATAGLVLRFAWLQRNPAGRGRGFSLVSVLFACCFASSCASLGTTDRPAPDSTACEPGAGRWVIAYPPRVADIDPSDNERRASRLAAAGAVGASVAHELRNALAVAESALFLAQRDLDDRPRLVRHLDQVGAEIRKAHHVIGSVLGLARGEPVRREPAPVRRLIDTARHAVVLPSNVAFEVAIEPAELTVLCDPILVERVFSNLYLNAVEALEGQPQAAIVTRAWLGDARTYLEVEDNGPGLDPGIVDRVFEPLATSKAQGTGLGCALSRAILEAHGGEITATTGRRGGVAFRMWLPNG